MKGKGFVSLRVQNINSSNVLNNYLAKTNRKIFEFSSDCNKNLPNTNLLNKYGCDVVVLSKPPTNESTKKMQTNMCGKIFYVISF